MEKIRCLSAETCESLMSVKGSFFFNLAHVVHIVTISLEAVDGRSNEGDYDGLGL